ncbi:MAG TPA: 4Fe-4S binding protein [Planctomycetota bacterium]|nr:4Fe-4S binding protein [Planctomycetota bacterium]
MPHTITARCVDSVHRACARVCPVDCIVYEPGVDRMCFVDPSRCIDCKACNNECPGDAIRSPDRLEAAQRVWSEVNYLYSSDRAAARARVDALVPRAGR